MCFYGTINGVLIGIILSFTEMIIRTSNLQDVSWNTADTDILGI